MWVALSAAAQAIHSNVQLASPYTSNWNHTIDVTDGIDAIPEAAHLAGSTIYVKPVTLFADTVQNRVQAVVLGGLEVTGSLWEKLLGFSSTQIGNNSQAVMTAASVARVDATRAIAFHCPTLCACTLASGCIPPAMSISMHCVESEVVPLALMFHACPPLLADFGDADFLGRVISS
jgi:hypothetical protein